jgi:hypothetical protein
MRTAGIWPFSLNGDHRAPWLCTDVFCSREHPFWLGAFIYGVLAWLATEKA